MFLFYRAWAALTNALAAFLAPFAPDSIFTDEDEDVRSWQDLQTTVVELLVVTVLPRIQSAPATFPPRLLSLFALDLPADAPEYIPEAQRRLEAKCLTGLFTLCRHEPERSEGGIVSLGSSRTVAIIACPMLITRCAQILRGYLEAETGAGGMSALMTEQACYILWQLGKLLIHPEVSASLFPHGNAVSVPGSGDSFGRAKDDGHQGSVAPDQSPSMDSRDTSQSRRNPMATERTHGSRGHLLKLFSTLCECIRFQDVQVRLVLMQVFHLCSAEMQT
jgi:hypothetical protein